MAGTLEDAHPVSEGHLAFAHTFSSLVPAGPKLAVSKAVVEIEMGLRVAATSCGNFWCPEIRYQGVSYHSWSSTKIMAYPALSGISERKSFLTQVLCLTGLLC